MRRCMAQMSPIAYAKTLITYNTKHWTFDWSFATLTKSLITAFPLEISTIPSGWLFNRNKIFWLHFFFWIRKKWHPTMLFKFLPKTVIVTLLILHFYVVVESHLTPNHRQNKGKKLINMIKIPSPKISWLAAFLKQVSDSTLNPYNFHCFWFRVIFNHFIQIRSLINNRCEIIRKIVVEHFNFYFHSIIQVHISY